MPRRRSSPRRQKQWDDLALELCLRAKAYIEQRGHYASLGETEYHGRKHDLFGFADIIAFRPSNGRVTLVQVTTIGNIDARARKLSKSPKCKAWCSYHSVIIVAFHTPYSKRKYGPTYVFPERFTVAGINWTIIRQPDYNAPFGPLIYRISR